MFKNILRIGIGQFLGLIITFIIGVVISRVYGPEGKGVITLLLLIPTLISTYLGFSIEEGYLYYIGKQKLSKKKFDGLLAKTFFYFFLLAFLVYVLTFNFLKGYEFYFLPQVLLIGLLFFNNIFKFSLRALLNFKRYNLIQILEPGVVLFGIVIILYFTKNAEILLWAYVASYIVSLFFQLRAIRLKLSSVEDTPVHLKDIFTYSYKVHFFKILNFTEAKFDVLLLGIISTTASVGIYSISISLAVLFQALVQMPISNVLYPSLIKAKESERAEITQKYFKLSYFLSFVFLIGMVSLGHFFIVFVYGQQFSGAYIPLIILVIGALPKASSACLNSYFKAIGRPEELYKTSIYTVSLNIILCFVLIPYMDMVGAAIASSISYFLYFFLMVRKFLKDSDVKISSFLMTKDDFILMKNFINTLKR